MRFGITAFLTDQSVAPHVLAQAAEARGFTSFFLPEHTHLPLRDDEPPSLVEGVDRQSYRRSLDPFVALATIASVTNTLRLGTGVSLVAQHDPITMAKQVATLDHLSNGRVDLGIGFGWNRAESADHGVDFAQRRAIAREHVLCMRALWSDEPAEFHGEFVDLDACWARPHPIQDRLPVLLGGGAHPSVFSAVVEYGDGWMPIGGSGLTEAIPALSRVAEEAGRDPAELRIVPFGTVPTPGKLDHFAALGIHDVVLRVANGTPAEMLGALDELRAVIDPYLGA